MLPVECSLDWKGREVPGSEGKLKPAVQRRPVWVRTLLQCEPPPILEQSYEMTFAKSSAWYCIQSSDTAPKFIGNEGKNTWGIGTLVIHLCDNPPHPSPNVAAYARKRLHRSMWNVGIEASRQWGLGAGKSFLEDANFFAQIYHYKT